MARLLPLLIPVCFAAFAHAAFDAAKYPSADELVLAYLPADVQPVRSVRVKSPSDAPLTLNLPSPGARLPEGAVWGEFDAERMKIEAEAVELARTLFEEKAAPRLKLDLATAAAELAERRAELSRQIGMLDRIAGDPSLAELYRPDPAAAAGAAPSGDEIAVLAGRLRGQLAVVDDVLRHAGSPEEKDHERRALELKLKAQELDVAQRRREFRLAMPFEGEITLIPPAPLPGKTLRVPSGTDLALIQDFSVIQAGVVIRRPEWRLLAPANLYLRHVARPGGPVVAAYRRGVVRDNLGRDELVYIFEFPEAQRSLARGLSGGQVMMNLVLRLGRKALIVPKIDLVLAAPDAFREGGWEQGVDAAIPGGHLLAVGETHLAVAAP